MKRYQRSLKALLLSIVVLAAIYGVWVLLEWYIAPKTVSHRTTLVQIMAVILGAIAATATAVNAWRNLKQTQLSTEASLENSRAVEERRAQSDTLQKYLEQMSQLLTERDLRSSEEGSDVRIVARSQTLTALEGLDSRHRLTVLQFLFESHLINGRSDPQNKGRPVVNLTGANFEKIQVRSHALFAHLKNAHLRGVRLVGADLSGIDMRGAYLVLADLTKANLSGANLVGANLGGAWLGDINLSNAHLENAELRGGANLNRANLSGAWLTDAKLEGAPLMEANMRGAHLNRADLSRSQLDMADLTEADLTGANLSEAWLRWANLTDAKVTEEQLHKAWSLKGALMPDGSIRK
jgi:uncharacterized protein YjbI with pentapeptide repeats